MKKVLLLPLVFCCIATAWGDDGFITWGNNPTGFRAPIFGPDPANPYNSITGQSVNLNGTIMPPGNTVYPGPLLQGSGYTFAIFAGPTSASANTLTLLGSTTFRTASANQ